MERTAFKKVPDAEKVTVSPKQEGVRLTLYNTAILKTSLNGKIVAKGDIVPMPDQMELLRNGIKGEEGAFEELGKMFASNFDKSESDASFGGFFSDLELSVLDTKPGGKVRVTNKTEFELFSEYPNPDMIPKSRLINVKRLPDLKGMIEVSGVYDMRKLAEADMFINRYEGKTKVVYFAGGYYFIQKPK